MPVNELRNEVTGGGWLSIAARKQEDVLHSIPPKWRLTPTVKAEHMMRPLAAASTCDILSEKQIAITGKTSTEILTAIRTGQLTSAEVTEAYCARAAISHQLVNCLVEFFPEEAIAVARELDAQYERNKATIGPLHGLPITIKDILHVKGRTVTMALVGWADNPPCETDASAVQIMRDAGAVIFGRTTMPQTGMALETVSNLWGRTLNPYNPAFGAGGSSGGEAALVAMHGVPASPLSTDIGGSIRAPAAFNGLYAMRPTAERVPKSGMVSAARGNVSIKVSAGPCCHSMEDVKLFVQLILTHPTLPHEPTCTLPYWTDIGETRHRLRIGLMSTDGVVDPHPPIKRALRETAAKIAAEGHDVVHFKPPFDMWEAALMTFALYFQTGAREIKAILESTGEPRIKAFEHALEVFNIRELSVPELFAHNCQQQAYKATFQEAWDSAEMDCIICPSAAAAGYPHDFPLWWGYTHIWNMLDAPSIIVPIKDLKINPTDDPRDTAYQPRGNPFDRKNWELYDPEIYKAQPVTLQIVGRPYRDEELISLSEVMDRIINASPGDPPTC